MAVIDVSFNIGRMALFTCPSHNRGVLKAIVAHNGTGTSRIVTIKDVFTPAATNGTASPTAITKKVLEFRVPADNHVVLDSNALGNGAFKVLGAVDASVNVHDSSGNICVIYDFEGGK